MSTRYYTTPTVARLYGTNSQKVLGWIASGELKAINLAENARGKRPRWRIRQEDLDDFERRRASVPPAPKAPRRSRRVEAAEVEYV